MSADVADFEKELRRRVRAEVRASPALLREYLARREWWVYKALRIGYLAVLPLGVVLMPVSLAAVFIGVAACFGAQGPFGGRGNSHFTAFGLEADCICGFILATGFTGVRRRLTESKQLAVGVHFPVSDSELLHDACLEMIAGGVFFAYMVTYLFGYFACQHGSSFGEWLATLFALLLYIPITWAMGVLFFIPSSRESLGSNSATPGKFLGTITIVLLAGSMLLGMGGIFVEPLASAIGALSLVLTPTGWINGIVCLAVVERNPLGWLFLVPIGLFIGFAVRRYHRGITIHEVMIRSDGSLRAVYDGQRAEVAGGLAAQNGVEFPNGVTLPANSPINAGLLREALLSPSPRHAGIFGGIWRRWMSDRDEAVLAALRWPGRITMRNWFRWAVGTIVLSYGFMSLILFFAPILQQPTEQDRETMVFMFSLLALAPLFGLADAPANIPSARPQNPRERVSAVRPSANRVQRFRPLYAHFPVGFGEATRTIAKSALFQLLCWLPIAIVLSGIGVAVAGMPTRDAVMSALGPGVCMLSALGMAICIKLSAATNDTRRLAAWFAWIPSVLLTSCACLVLCFAPLSDWSALALSVLTGSSWGFWRYYRHLYERGNVDIVR